MYNHDVWRFQNIAVLEMERAQWLKVLIAPSEDKALASTWRLRIVCHSSSSCHPSTGLCRHRHTYDTQTGKHNTHTYEINLKMSKSLQHKLSSSMNSLIEIEEEIGEGERDRHTENN